MHHRKRTLLVTILLSVFSHELWAGIDWDATAGRCYKPSISEPVVTQRDFRWGVSHAANRAKGVEIYYSGKRLYLRAYYDKERQAFVMPHTLVGDERPILLTNQFIESVAHHIETGLRNKYSEAIVFSDMGHSHLYFTKPHWENEYKDFVLNNSQSKVYEKMLADKELRMLYHTAEQIKLKDKGQVLADAWSQWRYHSRNVFGYANGQKQLEVLYAKDNKRYNTVIEIDGHHRWSAGFNISASSEGCFAYKVNGETRYFDISLESLPYSRQHFLASMGIEPQPPTIAR